MKKLSILILTILFFACNSNSPKKSVFNGKTPEEISEIWNGKTPEKISEIWTSIIRTYVIHTHVKENNENFNTFWKATSAGIKDSYETPIPDSISSRVISAKDSTYQYLNQRRSNQMLFSNGILINGKKHGTFEWYGINGKWSTIGHFFNDKPCGKWIYYSGNLNIDSIVDKGNQELLIKLSQDSILTQHLNKNVW